MSTTLPVTTPRSSAIVKVSPRSACAMREYCSFVRSRQSA